MVERIPHFGMLVILLGCLMLAILVGGVLLMAFRAKVLKSDSPQLTMSFSLKELRAMRERGEISEMEFQMAYSKTVARLKGNGERPADPSSPA